MGLDVESIGFVRVSKNIYSRRLHVLIWLQFDQRDGFLTLTRKDERGTGKWHSIILPKKMESIEQIQNVVKTISDE